MKSSLYPKGARGVCVDSLSQNRLLASSMVRSYPSVISSDDTLRLETSSGG